MNNISVIDSWSDSLKVFRLSNVKDFLTNVLESFIDGIKILKTILHGRLFQFSIFIPIVGDRLMLVSRLGGRIILLSNTVFVP